MNRQTINPDDPRMTDYLLGEMNAAERAEFEAGLIDSPVARRELASMRAVAELLSEGLRHEWLLESPAPALRVLPSASSPVPAAPRQLFYRKSSLPLAAAAALGLLLLAGSVLFVSNSPRGEGAIASAGRGETWGAPSGEPLHVPRLMLAEEVEDLAALDFVEGAHSAVSTVDASYLEAEPPIPGMLPASYKAPSSDRNFVLDRVDSYLPPVGAIIPARATTGMIERRLDAGRSDAMDRSSSFLVRGYVTLGEGESSQGSPALEFRPVSISGNPVVNEESDLRLLADLNGLQRALSEVIEDLPKNAEKRVELERVLERSREIVSQLRKDLSF